MATFLFWNISKNNLTNDIVTLCHENEVDILILAESTIKETVLLKVLNTGQRAKFIAPSNPSSYLSFFFKYPINSIQNVTDDGRISIYQISPPIGLKVLLVALHLPSKLYGTEDDQTYRATRVIQTIREAEEKMGHTNTLVIGDFHNHPFNNWGQSKINMLHRAIHPNPARRTTLLRVITLCIIAAHKHDTHFITSKRSTTNFFQILRFFDTQTPTHISPTPQYISTSATWQSYITKRANKPRKKKSPTYPKNNLLNLKKSTAM
jgi:hypothetical protein